MSDIASQDCEACRIDAPRVTEQEQEDLLKELNGWQIVEKKGVLQLLKAYNFANFLEAMEFSQKIAQLAEAQGHHPALLTEWGRVTVRWWSHKIGGLHRNDFIMAAKTDELR